jgi:cysteine desulfuration protein SufE
LIKDEFKTDSNVIKGCQSKVWLQGEKTMKKIVFTADSDAILQRNYRNFDSYFSNQTAKSILEADMGFIDAIGLKEHLSPALTD